MSHPQPACFIYVVGEEQSAIIAEEEGILIFTQATMANIATRELEEVIANVFARGHLFPGPGEALTALIHEFIARTEVHRRDHPAPVRGRCTIITAFRRLSGEIACKTVIIDLPAAPPFDPEKPHRFYTLLLDALPSFQDVFTSEAWAPDSKLIEIIKNASAHHLRKRASPQA